MLIDSYGRVIDYLRISLTQKCNFRCLYCMPEEGIKGISHNDILSHEEMFEVIKICIDNGVKKIRITGGEPLVRKGIENFIKMINDYKPNLDLAMTTNGFFLPQMCDKLKQAGLKRINISLDTLNPQKAALLARRDILSGVLDGIKTAIDFGFVIKLNTVALKGINDDEILNLLEFAQNLDVQIRYIEFMENSHANANLTGLKKDEILKIIGQKYNFKEITKSPNSPSMLYELENGYKFGIIDPHKHDFCSSCNRLRLDSEGLLIPCLYYDEGQSIFQAMREKNLKKAYEILNQVIKSKPEKNRWCVQNEVSNRGFYQTGG